MKDMMLSSGLMRRLEQLQLLTRRRARSALKGERRSRARGQSVEFADYRNYVVGDDLRYVDWNMYGRLDRLFVKLYEEERELSVVVLLDASESMTFGEPRKFDFARRLAAAVGYVALCGFDRASVVPFPVRLEQAGLRGALRSVRGRQSAMAMFRNLELLVAGGLADINGAMRQTALETRKGGLAVVLSDFLDPGGYTTGLSALLGKGFQVSVVQVLAPEEIEPTVYGDLRLVDAETGAVQEVTFGRHRMKAYRRSVDSYCEGLRRYCRSRGIGWNRVRSDVVLDDVLLKDLRATGLWG
jgi:uncharacterized protein (DUF58 family)